MPYFVLADTVLGAYLFAEGGDLLGNGLHGVGVGVDTYFEDGDEEVVPRGVSPRIYLEPLFRFGEGTEFRLPDGYQYPFANHEGDGLHRDAVGGVYEEVRVGEDGVLRFRIFGRGFNLFDLLTCLEIYLHEVFDLFLLLDGGVQKVYPQDVVVSQLVEYLEVGIAYYLVILLQVNRYRGWLRLGCDS